MPAKIPTLTEYAETAGNGVEFDLTVGSGKVTLLICCRKKARHNPRYALKWNMHQQIALNNLSAFSHHLIAINVRHHQLTFCKRMPD